MGAASRVGMARRNVISVSLKSGAWSVADVRAMPLAVVFPGVVSGKRCSSRALSPAGKPTGPRGPRSHGGGEGYACVGRAVMEEQPVVLSVMHEAAKEGGVRDVSGKFVVRPGTEYPFVRTSQDGCRLLEVEQREARAV
jgi:hypothetical protein